MALLNQGFVRSLNLDEIEDSFKAINNLAGGTITSDLVIFANNTRNITALKLISSTVDPTNSSFTDVDDAEGTTFTLNSSISTYGNGDPVKIKRIIKIVGGTHNPTLDTITLLTAENLTLNERNSLLSNGKVTLNETYFTNKTTQLNGKSFDVQSASTTQIILRNVGYLNDFIGNFDPDGPSNQLDNYPYITSNSLELPSVDPSGSPLSYDELYYVSFSNAINSFRLGYNFFRTKEIDQIKFNGLTRSVILQRTNICTKENIERLARPIFEDETFTYVNDVLFRTFNGNFDFLESQLDSANFFRVKKYLTSVDNIFAEPELSLEGTLTSYDPAEFIQNREDLTASNSPGVFILNKDLSTLQNIVKIRAYSDNTQPWKLNGSALEYQSLRDINGSVINYATQEMQIGNLIFGDRVSDGKLVISNIQSISTSGGAIPFNDPNPYVYFTHKFPVLIEGEVYSICCSEIPVTI